MSNAGTSHAPRHRLRRVVVIAAVVLAILLLVAVGVYAVAFLILAPMMAG